MATRLLTAGLLTTSTFDCATFDTVTFECATFDAVTFDSGLVTAVAFDRRGSQQLQLLAARLLTADLKQLRLDKDRTAQLNQQNLVFSVICE